MLKYKNPRLWAFAKEICRIKSEAKTFENMKDLRMYVKDNKNILPEVVEGWRV